MVGESPAAHVVRRNERRVVEQELGRYGDPQGHFHLFAQLRSEANEHAKDIWNKSNQPTQPSPEAKEKGEVWDAEICARGVCRRIKDANDKGTKDIHTLVPQFIKAEGRKVMKERADKRDEEKRKRGKRRKPKKGRPRER